MERIRFTCASCGRVLNVRASYAGRQFRCPGCGVVDRVPATGTIPPPVQVGVADKQVGVADKQLGVEEKQLGVEEKQVGVADKSVGSTSVQEMAGGTKPPVAIAGAARVKTPSTAEPEDFAPTVRFASVPTIVAEMDMTPMVDVTFLLLIFFMVTAAYSLQKSLELPSPDVQEEAAEARTLEELEADSDYVIVRIGRDNTVWVNEIEAPSEQEVLFRLREARAGGPGSPGPSSLLVLADPGARHETVVMVLDAGNAVGMENIRLACIEEEAL
jgi:biopolymer transport protein ExbD